MVVEEEATGAVISKEDLAASKAKAAKVAEVEKKEEEAAKPVVEKPKASLLQMRDDGTEAEQEAERIREGPFDPTW